MTELKLRLLKDGKIVGFMWLGDFNTGDGLRVRWKRTDEPENITHPIHAVNFDAFEIGVKVGDMLVFTGDIIQDGVGNTGEVIWDSFCFLVLWHRAGAGCDALHKALRYSKVIGNIHEQSDAANT